MKELLKVSIVAGLIYALGHYIVVFNDSRLRGYRAPYIQMTTTDSVVIRWLTEDNQFGVVLFGEDSDHLAAIELENASKKNHMVTLRNLKPGTRYYYQVGDISGFRDFDAEKNWFRTHPLAVEPARFWVIGNSGEAGETLRQVRDAALGWMRLNPPAAAPDTEKVIDAGADTAIDVWLSLGNLAYPAGTNKQFQTALFENFESLAANTALWPVYGENDDRRWTYFRIFDLPQNAEAGGLESHTEKFYAIDYSNVHVVMLDTQGSGILLADKMASWLEKDLAQNTLPWVIAVLHHPPYTGAPDGREDKADSAAKMAAVRENILPILERAGVDLVLSGHSAMYERSYLIDCAYADAAQFSVANIVSTGVNDQHQDYLKPLVREPHQGTIYVVTGSSSTVLQESSDHPAFHRRLHEAGSVVIDVDGYKLQASFINAKGEVRDEFSISKQADFVSAYQGCEE